jgi:hypothetical protein
MIKIKPEPKNVSRETLSRRRTIAEPQKPAERNDDVKQALANLRRKYGKADS